MRIAIIGAGGVGGYYGARLAQAGEDVVFVARGPHLAAMREHGLQIRDRDGDFSIDPVQATDDAGTIGAVDVALLCVKMYDTAETARLLQPALGPDSVVVTMQNGVEAPDIVAEIIGPGRTLGAATYISSTIEAPGIIRHNNDMARVDIGEPSGPASERVAKLVATLTRAGIEAHAADDMAALLWSKFVLLAANSGVAAVTRQSTHAVQNDPVIADTWRAAVDEVVRVGHALGVALPDDIVRRCLDWIESNPPIKPSLLVDLEGGRRLEVPWLSGAVHRLGQSAGVPTPIHSTIYAALRPFVDGAS